MSSHSIYVFMEKKNNCLISQPLYVDCLIQSSLFELQIGLIHVAPDKAIIMVIISEAIPVSTYICICFQSSAKTTKN